MSLIASISSSEIRLVEIQEKLCSDEEKASDQVSNLVLYIWYWFSMVWKMFAVIYNI